MTVKPSVELYKWTISLSGITLCWWLVESFNGSTSLENMEKSSSSSRSVLWFVILSCSSYGFMCWGHCLTDLANVCWANHKLCLESYKLAEKLHMYHLFESKIAHEGSYPCSRMRQVERNKCNRHANLHKCVAGGEPLVLNTYAQFCTSNKIFLKTSDVRTGEGFTSSTP